MHLVKRQLYPNRHPAFDGRKNLYASKTPLFAESEKTCSVKYADPGGKEKEFKVIIRRARDSATNMPVELTVASLFKYMKDNGCSINIPMSTIQAIDVALRGNLADRL